MPDRYASYSKTTEKARGRHLEHRHGLSQHDYQRMLEAEGGVCRICQHQKRARTLTASLHFHDLRHEFGCRLAESTPIVPPVVIREPGSRCFFNMKRRCFCVEGLYIGSTDASHSAAIVRNVTRDRVGALLTDVAASFSRRMSAASRRDILPSVSYLSTRFFVPSGAISHSRPRITHPFPFSRRQPEPY
jgi:hypothetical protein